MRYSFFLFVLFITTTSFAYRGDYRYGIMNTKGEIVTPPVYSDVDFAGAHHEHFLVVTGGNKKGVIGPDGKQVGKIEFDRISIYSRPLYEVYKNDKVGFMNQQGKITIPCIYDSYITTDEPNNWYEVRLEDEYGMVDENNNVIFPFEYSTINSYENDYTLNFALCKDGKYALANRKGEILTPFTYDRITLFTSGGGLATREKEVCFLSSLGEEIEWGSKSIGYEERIKDLKGLVAILGQEKRIQLYTYDGKKAEKEYQGKMPDRFSDGLLSIESQDGWIVVDTLGNTVFKKQYRPAGNYSGLHFRNGVAIARHKSGLVGVVDSKGDIVIPFQFDNLDHATYFGVETDNPPALFVRKNKDLKYNIITLEGEPLNDQWYGEVYCYENHGITVRKQRHGAQGLLSFDGKEILACEYINIMPLRNGLLLLEDEDRQIGFYNVHTGAKLDHQFDDWRYSDDGDLWIVEKEGKRGVITTGCRVALPCEYERVDITTDGHFIVTNEDNVSAILDQEGKVIRPFKKERLTYLWDDLILFRVSSR